MSEITMPRLSDSMQEGTIIRWLIADGETVSRGDELVEIETDKATMTYEADADGILETAVAEGESVTVGVVIASIGRAEPATEGDAGRGVHGDGRPPRSVDGRIAASPVARRLARTRGVDLALLRGSGPGGRIVKADVEAAAEAATGTLPATSASTPIALPPPTLPPPTLPSPTDTETARGDVTVEELSRTAATVVRRMAEAKATIPEFTIARDVDMRALIEIREQLRSATTLVPSLNDLIVKASAIALREHPRTNGAYRDGRVELYSRVNIGIAVAARNALVVPTIFDADQKGLGAIAAESRRLAAAVRDGSVTPAELAGGTFTISNLGMYGVRHFTAVINPPQAAILAVGSMRPEVRLIKGTAVERNVMTLTLSCDHRILYGADAAAFLGAISKILEEPWTMLL